jgi:hypothetical protein
MSDPRTELLDDLDRIAGGLLAAADAMRSHLADMAHRRVSAVELSGTRKQVADLIAGLQGFRASINVARKGITNGK